MKGLYNDQAGIKITILPDLYNNCTVVPLSLKVKIMLEYTKNILQKVSFSQALFGKELKKSLQWLQKEEIYILRSWCVLTFGDLYFEIIMDSFKGT